MEMRLRASTGLEPARRERTSATPPGSRTPGQNTPSREAFLVVGGLGRSSSDERVWSSCPSGTRASRPGDRRAREKAALTGSIDRDRRNKPEWRTALRVHDFWTD